jgi:transcriptional regulator with XRE-family HTH domain
MKAGARQYRAKQTIIDASASMININKHLGRILKDLRIEQGRLLSVVALELDMYPSHLCNLEKNLKTFNIERLFEICQVYGVRPGIVLDHAIAKARSENVRKEKS